MIQNGEPRNKPNCRSLAVSLAHTEAGTLIHTGGVQYLFQRRNVKNLLKAHNIRPQSSELTGYPFDLFIILIFVVTAVVILFS